MRANSRRRRRFVLILAAALLLLCVALLPACGRSAAAGRSGGELTEAEASRLKKGDIVTFGRWEQDNNPDNGPEPVEWMVLDRIGDEVLLLSLFGLDGRQYHNVPFADVTWEDCALRGWLNGEFLQAAFSREEQALLMQAGLQNADQSASGTEGGRDTRDRVFLLSETDAVIYMGSDAARQDVGQTFATEYARAQGAPADPDGMTEWWLRSPGADGYTAQFVTVDGDVHTAGAYADIVFAVRPAVWIKAGAAGG